MNRKLIGHIGKAALAAGILGIICLAGYPRSVHVELAQQRAQPSHFLSQSVDALRGVNTAWASALGGGLVPNVINMIRIGVGNVIGYSSTANYQDLVCGGTSTCSGPPQNGIVGAIVGIVGDVSTITAQAGIANCSEVPATGSVTGPGTSGSSVTVTFGTPTHSIPAGWVNGGTLFAKRATFNETVDLGGSSTPLAVAYEFNCGANNAAYVAVSMAMDNVTGYSRDITAYHGIATSSGKGGIQVFMAEHDRTTPALIRSAYAIDIQYDDTTNLFNMWGVLTGNLGFTSGLDLLSVNRVNISGNFSTGKALVFDHVISFQPANLDNNGTIDATILGLSTALLSGVEADPSNSNMNSDLTSGPLRAATHLSPAEVPFEACIDFTATSGSNAPSHPDCVGFTLVAPADATPAPDASGDWSIHWAVQTMGGKLEQLTTP